MVSHERGEMLSLTKTDTTTNRHKASPNYNCPASAGSVLFYRTCARSAFHHTRPGRLTWLRAIRSQIGLGFGMRLYGLAELCKNTCSILSQTSSEEPPMATHRYNVPIHQDVSKRYASDLNDQEFALIAPHVAQE